MAERDGRPAVVVLSRPGCCLCDDAVAIIEEVAVHRPLDLEVVNIDENPELAERFGLVIPVVYVDGALASKGPLNRKQLERRLEGGGILARLKRHLRWPV
jgi:thioredoxin-like negative regulator of GroEL